MINANRWANLDLLHWLGQILTGLTVQRPAPRGYTGTPMPLAASQQVSILFTDVVGFSYMMSVWPLEVVVSSLNCYFERLSRCVSKSRGQVDKFIGDGMMAVFESPDDAVSAAQEIQQEVAGYNSEQTGLARCAFPTRIVVDTGLVVRTALGPGRDRDWTVMGPVVNTASHLAKILPPDRVFISHSTRCQLRDRDGLCLAGPQTVNGHRGELVVYEATA